MIPSIDYFIELLNLYPNDSITISISEWPIFGYNIELYINGIFSYTLDRSYLDDAKNEICYRYLLQYYRKEILKLLPNNNEKFNIIYECVAKCYVFSFGNNYIIESGNLDIMDNNNENLYIAIKSFYDKLINKTEWHFKLEELFPDKFIHTKAFDKFVSLYVDNKEVYRLYFDFFITRKNCEISIVQKFLLSELSKSASEKGCLPKFDKYSDEQNILAVEEAIRKFYQEIIHIDKPKYIIYKYTW